MGVEKDQVYYRVMEIEIGPARGSDAENILGLQLLCYQSEARLYDDYEIPPLTQSLGDLLHEYDTHLILAAYLQGEVIGSVRGHLEDETCHIGRLIVHPRLRRRGLGARLMREIEDRFVTANRYEIFTGHLSEDNLRLYHRLGYSELRREAVSPRLWMIYLEKPRTVRGE